MVKETGYCNYCDMEWVEKYNDLIYNQYRTKIEGNTFYIISNVLMESHITSFQRWVLNKIHISTLFCDHTIYYIPMIKAQEETIRDTLRSYNFDVKYKWLDKDLETESKKLLDSYIDELDCGDNGNIPAKQCPSCGYTDPCDFEDVYDVKYEYCPMCGQKLDREEKN